MRDATALAMRASHWLTAVFAAGAVVFGVVAHFAGDVFYLRLATEALIYAGLAMSVDVLLGYSGLLSLGQALYFGLGAYVSALVLKAVPSFWLAMGAALVAALVTGAIGGIVANRVRGVYFALITFGLAEVVAKIVYNTPALGASDGMIGVPIVKIDLGIVTVSSNAPLAFFIFVLVFILIVYALTAYVLSTPFGRLLIALRANERRVSFLGFSTVKARFAAYLIAAVIATLCGALYPMLRGFVAPELLFFSTSGDSIIMAMLGGIGTLTGGLYGSMLLAMLRSVVGSWTEHHLIVIGTLFMLAVIFLPGGVIGLVRARIVRAMAPKKVLETLS